MTGNPKPTTVDLGHIFRLVLEKLGKITLYHLKWMDWNWTAVNMAFMDIWKFIHSKNHSDILHRVVASSPIILLFHDDSPSSTLEQLSSYLRSNTLVTLDKQQIQQSFSLVFGNVVFVSLRKRKQTLMPEDGQFVAFGPWSRHTAHRMLASVHRRGIYSPEPQKVENQCIHDLEWQGVLLVQENADEDVRCAS